MRPIAAIAWDIDGTLIDSEPHHLDVLTRVSRRHGLDMRIVPDEVFRGMHLPAVWDVLAPRLPVGVSRASWIDEIIATYVEGVGRLVPLAGAREAMTTFAARGIRQVCVSNSNRRIVDANIRALGIEPMIEFSISLDDVTRGKPDPEPYRRACAALGLDPAGVAAVEDSRTGAASALAAGLLVVGYSPGGDPIPGVDLTIADLATLPGRLLPQAGAPDLIRSRPDGG